MVTLVAPCRAFILYRNGLFAEGVRSVLAKRRTVQIVGMQRNVAKALKAVESLQPDVIILEASLPGRKTDRLEALLDGAAAGRVVRLSLDHYHATVYHHQHVESANAGDLVRAIRGVARRSSANGQSGAGQSGTRISTYCGCTDGRRKKNPTLRARRAETRREVETSAQRPVIFWCS